MSTSNPWLALRRCALLNRKLVFLNERLESIKVLAGRAEEKTLLVRQIQRTKSELGSLKQAGFAL